ncbi:CDP-diacylglycerol--glycerol-3-phosphate 3-phosphatidyltransferase [Lutibaculum baratangense]|uniref:CDP-diacylglycerol--glycerol-3-phosphate 3-phosphatidyltransferase n=1 Tax=Lutibaculum baratangense AMV1 TaxID=631454 RepID=V4RAJ3_9HYPH|nr:CDP-diacylglycerol--glycerol-3-phosphate 3-phosphatidyltransferase [Lutibaculum baratangense]ESR23201.1 CDP-diacylglycerol--glycerol-3-phosphate 3-phosphatidyltransferase [Lutibaculum baratangense AMV1]
MVTNEASGRDARSKSHALALPNLLTYGRVAAVPAVGACFYIDGFVGNWIALGLFVTASITDFFDGYLARAWQQQSALGRMLDPIADKLLVAVALMTLVADRTIGAWSLPAAIVILSREVLVSGLREFLAELHVSVPVSQLAKWKTTAQMVAIGVLLAGPAGEAVMPGLTFIGRTLLWISAILTIYTGWDYLRAAIRHAIGEDS